MWGAIASIGLSIVGWFLNRGQVSDELKQQFNALTEKIQGSLTWWGKLKDDERAQNQDLDRSPKP